jgi:hypothetical protein
MCSPVKFQQIPGIIDVILLPFNGILTGWLAMNGWVFCTNPDLIYILGAHMLGKYL